MQMSNINLEVGAFLVDRTYPRECRVVEITSLHLMGRGIEARVKLIWTLVYDGGAEVFRKDSHYILQEKALVEPLWVQKEDLLEIRKEPFIVQEIEEVARTLYITCTNSRGNRQNFYFWEVVQEAKFAEDYYGL